MERVRMQEKSRQGYNLKREYPGASHVAAARQKHFFDCPPRLELLTYTHTMYMSGRNSLQCHCTCACCMPLDGARGLSEEPGNP
jgi:hypothetical protein